MANSTDTLTLKLALSGLAQTEAGFKSIINTVGNLGKGLIALTGGALLGASAKEAINFQEELGKLQQGIGGTIADIQGLAYAGRKADLDLGTLRQGLKQFSEHLVKSGEGSKSLKAALLEQADVFKNLPDGALKAQKAVELFGRSGLQWIDLLNEGSEKLGETFGRGGELAGFTDESTASAKAFNDSLKDFKLASEGLAGSLASTLLPSITKTVLAATNGAVAFRDWTKQSIAFKEGIELAGVALGAFAAYKVSLGAISLGTTAFTGLVNLVGPIKNVSDLAAALRLLPGAFLAANSAAITLTGSLALLTTAIVAGIEAYRMFDAFKTEKKSAEDLTQRNLELAASLRNVIDEKEALGVIDAKMASQLRGNIDAALLHPETADKSLIPMAQDFNKLNPATIAPKLWTKDELDVANKMLDTTRSIWATAREGVDLKRELPFRLDDAERLFSIHQEENLLEEKRKNFTDALAQQAITEKEAEEAGLAIDKERLALDKLRAAIGEKDREAQKAVIAASFRLTDAEKFTKIKLLSTPDERATLGPDPNSFADQWESAFTRLKNGFGTLQQQIATGFTGLINTAIGSVSAGITGLITRTRTWAQVLTQIGTSILGQVIDAIVKMFVSWVTGRLTVKTVDIASQAATAAAAIAVNTPVAAALGAIWAVPATLSTIASYGASAAAAPGAIAIAEAITLASSAFASGGYTGDGGRNEAAGIVHKGEFVLPARIVGQPGALPALQAILAAGRMPQMGGGFADGGFAAPGGFELTMPSELHQASSFIAPERTGTSTSSDSLPSFRQKQVHVHMHADMPEILKYVAQNPEHEHIITGIMSRNRHVVVSRG